jgi:hypothetical protein
MVAMPLQIVVVEEAFEKCGIYIIEEINPNFSKGNKYILTITDYFT